MIKVQRRKDYKKPEYLFKKTFIDFVLDPERTVVKSRIEVSPVKGAGELVLDRSDMDLTAVSINGKKLVSRRDYAVKKNQIVIGNPPKKAFILEMTDIINPSANKTGGGLYTAGGVFTTQCEAESFHKIIPYQDRPDVLSEYYVTITADKKSYPVLLSNGNKIGEKDNGDGTHTVSWHDPFLKPCYLFALVAGDLGRIVGEFTTCSGRRVELNVYGEKGKEQRLKHALSCLKKAMRWDEKVFHREYDLDLFNIVAVSSFNAGAMENKSLNIFNDKYVLADHETATDYEHFLIDGVIAHEYFHNWSGDRVTVAYWHDLSLKEGFTVCREHMYSRDIGSETCVRMDQVNQLKAAQFTEDAGPNAHAVRPDKYIGVDNIYSTTIYEKGGELIEMLRILLGDDLFFKGCDYYFAHNDGKAVTIDDFIAAFEHVSGRSLSDFTKWYYQAGTPHVTLHPSYDAKKKVFTVNAEQITYPTAKQKVKKPLVIPLKSGLISRSTGKDVLETVMVLTKTKQKFVFKNIAEDVVLSANRSFSAPIYLNIDYTDEEKAFLMANDSDLFNRAEVAESYITENIIKNYNIIKSGVEPASNPAMLKALKTILANKSLDKEFIARAVAVSSVGAFNRINDIDPDALRKASRAVETALSFECHDEFVRLYNENAGTDENDLSFEAVSSRMLMNKALYYLTVYDKNQDRVLTHYRNSSGMTGKMAAMSVISRFGMEHILAILDNDFYNRYKNDTLVITKWIRLKAAMKGSVIAKNVKNIMNDPAFDKTIPNHMYALLSGTLSNDAYHDLDGEGYRTMADLVLQMLPINPAVAGRIVKSSFSMLKKYDKSHRDLMLNQVKRIGAVKDLPPNVYEIVNNILSSVKEV